MRPGATYASAHGAAVRKVLVGERGTHDADRMGADTVARVDGAALEDRHVEYAEVAGRDVTNRGPIGVLDVNAFHVHERRHALVRQKRRLRRPCGRDARHLLHPLEHSFDESRA